MNNKRKKKKECFHHPTGLRLPGPGESSPQELTSSDHYLIRSPIFNKN
jgi:hypothetical protein